MGGREIFNAKIDQIHQRLHRIIFDKIFPVVSQLRRLKLRTRFIVFFAAFSLIPLLTISIFAYRQYTDSIYTKLGKSSFQLLQQLDRNIQTEIDKYEHVCDQLSIDGLIQDSLIHYPQLDDTAKGRLMVDINQLAIKKGLFLSFIQNIYIVTSKGEILFDFGYDSFDNDTISRFITGVNRNRPLDYWTYAKTRRGLDTLVLCRAINHLSDTSIKLGYIFVVIDDAEFSKWTFTYVDMGKGANVLMMNEEGVLFSDISKKLPLGKPYPDRSLLKHLLFNQKKNSSMYTTDLEGQKHLILFTYTTRTKWYLIATIPFSYIRSEISGINMGLILISIGCLIFSVILSLLITLSIDLPLNRMVNQIKKISAGNLEVSIDDEYNDEMGYLSQKFDAMVIQFNKLNRQYQEDQTRKRELELNMLQAQINPHFLFNTLNSLKWTAQLSRVTTVSDGLGALADLLSNTIIHKNELIPLQEELRNIENYLLIQKIRYGDSFRVVFEIQEEIKENLILKFLLQPIVENSIIHGLADHKNLVTITIQGYSSQDNMEILIRDDGIGFDPKEVNAPLKNPNSEKLSKIGIDNVRDRIILHFGEKFGLEIKSSIGVGTEVIMRLPILKCEV